MNNIMLTKKQQEKERELFTIVHNVYVKGLNTYAYYKVNNRSKSEDLVQDTFLKTWKYIVKGGRIEIMRAFLYHILNDLIIDQYRKHKTVSLDVLIQKGFEPNVDDSEFIMNNFDGKVALLLIKLLPEKYQRVMHMRYVQDLSIKEIALITKESHNTVAVQLHRGLQKIKKMHKSY